MGCVWGICVLVKIAFHRSDPRNLGMEPTLPSELAFWWELAGCPRFCAATVAPAASRSPLSGLKGREHEAGASSEKGF